MAHVQGHLHVGAALLSPPLRLCSCKGFLDANIRARYSFDISVIDIRLEGTSKIIWPNLSCQKQMLGKVALHPVQLNLRNI